MKFKPIILTLTAALAFMLVVNIHAQTQNPVQPASPKKEQRETLLLCCLTPSELAALQAKAEGGDVEAQKTMVQYYNKKIRDADFGSDIDDYIANYLKWMRKAAEAGDVNAQGDLGAMYDRGIRAEKNIEEGRKWLLKAAAQGDPVAMGNLCHSYTEPLSLSKGMDPNTFPLPRIAIARPDMVEALTWCEKGANGGNRESQERLGWLYARGNVDAIKADYEKAYFWLVVSRSKHPLRETIGNQLTPEKHAEIETRARTWKPTRTPPRVP
jgi:Sel1 repeat